MNDLIFRDDLDWSDYWQKCYDFNYDYHYDYHFNYQNLDLIIFPFNIKGLFLFNYFYLWFKFQIVFFIHFTLKYSKNSFYISILSWYSEYVNYYYLSSNWCHFDLKCHNWSFFYFYNWIVRNISIYIYLIDLLTNSSIFKYWFFQFLYHCIFYF